MRREEDLKAAFDAVFEGTGGDAPQDVDVTWAFIRETLGADDASIDAFVREAGAFADAAPRQMSDRVQFINAAVWGALVAASWRDS